MERCHAGLGRSVLALTLGLAVFGCSAARPPATSPETRPPASKPAVRLDGGGTAPPAARARGGEDTGFERGTVREESLSNARPSAAHEKNAEKRAHAAKADDAEPEPAARDEDDTDAVASEDERGGGVHADPDELRHILQRGQTLYSVSRMYGVSLEALMRANRIHNARKVAAGTALRIPLDRPERTASEAPHDPHEKGEDAASSPAARKAKHQAFLWPIEGAVTGGFGPRGKHSHHEGIDIDGLDGDEIRAAASGTVAFAGGNGDYGRTVIIDHGDGLRTLYGHASKLLVEEGDEVHAGDIIAAVGHSGNARGSHLHFEVRRDGRAVNPLPYLLPTDVLTAGAVTLPHTTKPASRRQRGVENVAPAGPR